MLLANAGSGKTYSLTTRIIKLLLSGVSIDQIAALTFTRKSAGEFLDELLIRLADAATIPDKLKELAEATGKVDLSYEECSKMLRHIIDHFGRLGLSTIDSFFTRIARQFPLESGLPEEFAIADNARLASARERALAKTFSLSSDGYGIKAMIEQCRKISLRNGERDIFGTLLNQIDALHQRYLETPVGCTWGEANTIWKNKATPFKDAPKIRSAIEHFERVAKDENPDLSEEGLTYLDSNLDSLREIEPDQTWNKSVKLFVKSKLVNEPKNGQLQLTRKKTGWLELTPTLRVARSALADALFADVLQQSLERSEELHTFVRRYESVYADLVRNTGIISFADITALLAKRAADSDVKDALNWRAQVAYRIDQYFDHWLLDEFQDTSRIQWTILKTFIEEVVMDDSAERSFFYVGDTKQAIYGWRGGDSELFREIFTYYDSIEEALPLTESWRSCEPIIKMVNLIFGAIVEIQNELKLTDTTLKHWLSGWNNHTVCTAKRSQVGYASWHPVTADLEEDIPPQHLEIRRIIERVDPLRRGIECAVLLRQNKDVAQLSAYLQSAGISVAIEGKSNPCTDNPLGSAVLASLRAVAHPADSLSIIIAQGYPCATQWGLDNIECFRSSTLQSIAEHGYAKTLKVWIDGAFEVAEKSTTDCTHALFSDEAFLQSRAQILLATAENFDASYSNEGIDAFIAVVEASELQEVGANEAIRIMTVHQAKGLGFEMVIASGLDKKSPSRTVDELIIGPDRKNPQWGILLPSKEISLADPVLREQRERLESMSKADELCGAYVALTRAKRALYVVSDTLKQDTNASHFGRHLQLTLEEHWSEGDYKWFEKKPIIS